jgi:hypothetical protein
MKTRIALALVVLTTAFVSAQGTAPKGPKKKDDSPAGYKKDNLRGFLLYFSDEVLKQDRDSKLERKPLEALERELIIVENVLPADKVKNLKAVPIWVEWNERLAMGNGRRGGAVAVFYGGHQSNLLGGDKNPVKANAVTILSLKSLTAEHQPKTDSGRCVTLHELAHAFHHFVVGDNPLVSITYKQSMERKLYDKELYIATNEHEYFAELTCAYLDRLDYFPRNRDELKKHDPKAYEMMIKLWGPAPIRKDAVATKGPKLPSPNGDGAFSLDATTKELKLGPKLVGELPPSSERAGRPLLVYIFRATSGRSLAVLPKLNALQAELGDFGLITIGAEAAGVPEEYARRIARERNIDFPLVDDADVDAEGGYVLPHAFLFDHNGQCVFRGSALDLEPHVRIAVGKAIVAKVGKESFGKPAQPVVDLLESGAPMTQVMSKLQAQLRATGKDSADELNAIQNVITEKAKQVLDAAIEKAKTDPIAAFFETERLPNAYRGTPIEKPAFEFVNKLKGNPKVEWETKARNTLPAIRKIDTQLSGKDLSFNPKSLDFKEDNSVLLKQLADAVEKLRKTYPTTRAADEALKYAERWDVKVKQ